MINTKSLKKSFYILALALTLQIQTATSKQKLETIHSWIDTVSRNLVNDNKGNAHPLQLIHALLANLSVDLNQTANKTFNTPNSKMIDEKRAAFNTAIHLMASDAIVSAQFPADSKDIPMQIFDAVLEGIPTISINDKIRAMIASGYVSKDKEEVSNMVQQQKYSQTALSYPNNLSAISSSIEKLTAEKPIEDYSFEELLTQGKTITDTKIGDLIWQAVYLKTFNFLANTHHVKQYGGSNSGSFRVNAIADLLIHSLSDNPSDNDKLSLILSALQSAKIAGSNIRLYSDEKIMDAIISTDIDMNQLSSNPNGPELLSRLDPVSQLNFLRTEDLSKTAADQIKAMLEKLHQIRPDIYKDDLNYAMQQVYLSYTFPPSLNTIAQIIKGFLEDINEEFFGKVTKTDKLTEIATALKTIGSSLPSTEAIDAIFLSQYAGKEAPDPTLTGNETQSEIAAMSEENLKLIDLDLVQKAGEDTLQAVQLAKLNGIRAYDEVLIKQWFTNSTNNTTSLMMLRDKFELISTGGISGTNLVLVRK